MTTYNVHDPDPWDVLLADRQSPFSPIALKAFVRDRRTLAARFVLPFVRAACTLGMLVTRMLRFVVPVGDGNGLLHRIIVWGLGTFGTPDAMLLTLRHMHLGTQILEFLSVNLGIEAEGVEALRPRSVADLRHNVFLKHDLNVFNFLHAAGRTAPHTPRRPIDYSMLTDDIPLASIRRRWTNAFDIESAVTIYTVLYALFLPKASFERASHSLQYDEHFARLVAQAVGQPLLAALVFNRHPVLPDRTTSTARRVMVHAVETEALHHLLLQLKAAAETSTRLTPAKVSA